MTPFRPCSHCYDWKPGDRVTYDANPGVIEVVRNDMSPHQAHVLWDNGQRSLVWQSDLMAEGE